MTSSWWLVFYHLASVDGTSRFPFAHHLAENKGRCGEAVMSCSGFCGKGILLDPLKCSCDESCLYIGDCCFDYVYLCIGGYDFDAALVYQGQIMHSFVNKTILSPQYVQSDRCPDSISYNIIHIPMITKCPSNATKKLRALCENYERHTLPALPEIPVIHRKIIYRNVYCSLCNDADPEKVSLLAHELINTTGAYYALSQPFALLITEIDSYPIGRFKSAHYYTYKIDNLNCLEDEIAGECMAYQAPIKAVLPENKNAIFRNLACAECANASLDENMCSMTINSYTPLSGGADKWISLFDFVGKSNFDSSPERSPVCNSTRCQDGYILMETSCTYCMKEQNNPPAISVTWFHPTILLIFKSKDAADRVWDIYGGNFTQNDQYCTKHIHWLQEIGLVKSTSQVLNVNNACLVFPISYLEVQFYINIYRSDTFMDQILPGLKSKLHAAFVFNFDVKYKPYCEQGIIMSKSLGDIAQETSNITDEPHNGSYHSQTPRVFVRSFVVSGDPGLVSKLVCADDRQDNLNCSNMNVSDFSTCPKVEIKFSSKSEHGFWTKNGLFINHHQEYILTRNQTALLCVNQCNIVSFVDTKTLDILVPVCYSISMSCLMITFLIYLATPQLRNIPGLMLMNLIVALFFAQMSYLISTSGLLVNDPGWCQFLGATQHYFWLTAFAWMACITIDIYQCLSSINVSHPDSHKRRYYKLVASCWLVPLILPIITICTQLSGSASVGYGGQHTCWFINPRSVLYFFAIPVLTIVFSNITMFLGCVYRIRQISNNACYLGRKEDGKLRLIQCLKISSWIGISWLFGILPNIINRSELWYMFTICNAFQGVQIFLAFGLSERSRKFACLKNTDHTNELTMSTTANTGW